MGKLLRAFAAGVALTTVAFVLFDGTKTTSITDEREGVVSSSPFARDPISASSSSNVALPGPEVVSIVPPVAAVSDAVGMPEDLLRFAREDYTPEERRSALIGWTDDELQALVQRGRELTEPEPSQEMVEASLVMSLARQELDERSRVARWADAPPPDLPIELPPEFSYLSEDPNNVHETLLREPVDQNWSPQMEAQLQGFFASRPEFTTSYGLPKISCRTSLCEVAFVAYGLDSDQVWASWDFEIPGVLGEVFDQSWGEQLVRRPARPLPRFHESGATTMLWFIERSGE